MSLETQKFLRIGDEAPNFTADTSTGEITWHNYIDGKWAILFSHPRDFTPVCTTEIAKVAVLKKQWANKNTVVAVVSADDVESHKSWITEIEKVKKCKVDFPIIGDEKRAVCAAYGMLDQTNMDEFENKMPATVRSVYFIGPDKKIKLIMTYPASTGRNFDEIIRCLDSLQLAVSHKVATPADWRIGSDVCLLPSLTDEDAAGYKDLKIVSASCKLRMLPCPIGGNKQKNKKDKKSKGPAQQPKKTKAEKEAEQAAKDAEKKIKAVKKEGGKKGQDVEGMNAMGCKGFNVNLMEPNGNMEFLSMAFEAMNVHVDPSAEERKGGAGPFPKMVISAGEKEMSALLHVPEEAKELITLETWAEKVFGFMNLPYEKLNDTTIKMHCMADENANRFPLKDRDVLIGTSFDYLKELKLVIDDDSDEEDYSGAAGLGVGGEDY